VREPSDIILYVSKDDEGNKKVKGTISVFQGEDAPETGA
jgi:hypothetical protein